MRADEPDWESLLALHVVAEAGSLSKASERLGLSQPTLSRRIDALEAALGGQVLVRDTQGCRVTELGARLLPAVAEMRAQADHVRLLARAHQSALSGTVRLACGPLPGQHVARNLERILGGHPGLQLEVAPSNHYANLPGGEADLALRDQRPEKGDLTVRRVGRAPWAVFGTPPLLDAQPEARDPSRWARCRWVGYLADQTPPSARWLRARIGRDADQRFASSLSILEAAASGAGLAALPIYAGAAEPRLEQISGPLEDLGFDSWLVAPTATRHLPHVRWVADRVVALFQEAHHRPSQGRSG
ncbi:MAG: LysR family transcriptional regulator [Alphaproteobacteria bacterium]|nr:LysR family transcriptional regulator [Alphaproteobacteria bacterium]